jgi:hypothetical protein
MPAFMPEKNSFIFMFLVVASNYSRSSS